MKRRLQIAGAALCACLVPACASIPAQPVAKHPSVTPPSNGTKAASESFAGAGPVLTAKKTRTLEKFGEGRAEPKSTIVQRAGALTNVPFEAPPVAAPAELPIEAIMAAKPTEASIIAPKVPETPVVAEKAPVAAVAAETAPEPPVAAVKAPEPPAVPTRLAFPASRQLEKPAPEPVTDAEGVIRASWPVLKEPTLPAEGPKTEVKLPHPSELIPPAKTDEAIAPPPMVAPLPTPTPTPLPPGVIGSSVHQSNASPVDVPAVPATVAPLLPATNSAIKIDQPPVCTDDSSLIRAMRALQMNKPDDAMQCLKSYDPASQQVIMSLLPALVRLSGGNLDQIKAEEFDILLEQIAKAPNILRPRASLQANNVRLCREVHNFAHVEPFGNDHQFRPGDIVYLYMELVNFSCTANPKSGFTIVLSSGLELRDSAGKVFWKADPKDVPDAVSTPPQDYYRNFRLCVPSVPPGSYQLTIRTTDRPTGREVVKTVEMRIGTR